MSGNGKASFLREADELLNAIGDHILALERRPDDKENVDHVFRAAHTLKGSANLYDYSGIAILTHLLESVLDDLRNGTRVADAALIDILLESFDQVRSLAERIRDGEDDPQSEPELLHRLGRFLSIRDREEPRAALFSQRATDWAAAARDFMEGTKDADAFAHFLPTLSAADAAAAQLTRYQVRQAKAAAAELAEASALRFDDTELPALLESAAAKFGRMSEKAQGRPALLLFMQFVVVCTLLEAYARKADATSPHPHWWSDVCDAVRDGAESWANGTAPERFSDVVLDVWELCKPREAAKQEFGTLLAPAAFESPFEGEEEEGRPPAPPGASSADALFEAPPRRRSAADASLPDLAPPAGRLVVEQLHFLAPKGRPMIERWELARELLRRCAEALGDDGLLALAAMQAPDLTALNERANRYLDGPAKAEKGASAAASTSRAAGAAGRWTPEEGRAGKEAAASAAARPTAASSTAPGTATASATASATVTASASAPAPAPADADQIIRVETGKVERLMELIGELAVARNAFPFMIGKLRQPNDAAAVAAELKEKYAVLDRITRDLQDAIVDIRMLPVSFVFNKFHRFVRDMARQSGKRIRLAFEGEETTLDKTLVEAISDPLIHLIRNAIDHGIEPSEARARAGKPTEGLLRISAFREGNRVVLEVYDDGAGVDTDRIADKLRETGELPEDRIAAMTQQELVAYVFRTGLSTAEEVTTLSGRGVGMDAVKKAIHRLQGDVGIRSERGAGTTVRIELPLTLSMTHILQVSVGGSAYGIPLEQIEETLRVSAGDVRTMQGEPVVILRDTVYPVVDLRTYLSLPEPEDGTGAAAAAKAGDSSSYLVILGNGVALRVDGLAGQQEVVVKPPEDCFKHLSYLAGASILGDGTVLLILNGNAIRFEPRKETVEATG
ncbi:chemotaxis protein CheA [Paenibacillus antri]|uniref:Chemotaxis protein CheA n=1 Tax=Paenibacillus antri TaxID=2582848 RepID=A0A5R9FZJ8_9BACL|nr:chemotaxis protein CheA [Paenibacillus antri]TLS49487.1 chemotaxis protein CheA [Paenibacillus antri]